MTIDLKAVTLEGFERMFNQGDLDYVDQALAVGSTDHQEAEGTSFAPHLKQVIATLRTGFPDLHFEVEAMVGEGNVVFSRSMMTGTHLGVLELGPLAAIEPAGAKVELRHMHMFQYAPDGRLDDLWHVWDTGVLMRQLGAPLPAMRVA